MNDLRHERKKGSISALMDPYFAGFIEGHVMSMRQQLTLPDASTPSLQQPPVMLLGTAPARSIDEDSEQALQLPLRPGTA
jgi:hypothetical protein